MVNCSNLMYLFDLKDKHDELSLAVQSVHVLTSGHSSARDFLVPCGVLSASVLST